MKLDETHDSQDARILVAFEPKSVAELVYGNACADKTLKDAPLWALWTGYAEKVIELERIYFRLKPGSPALCYGISGELYWKIGGC